MPWARNRAYIYAASLLVCAGTGVPAEATNWTITPQHHGPHDFFGPHDSFGRYERLTHDDFLRRHKHLGRHERCDLLDLNPKARARCYIVARRPSICLRRNIDEKFRLACDQMRFAGEPHFTVVRLTRQGVVRSIHLIETRTGREVFTGYPYGMAFATAGDNTYERRMKADDLGRFLRWHKRTPTLSETPTSSAYATGLIIGWNDSTGAAVDQCLNYSIQTPSDQVGNLNFSSQETANSTAGQIKVSATVKGSYDGFTGSDQFTYSDQYKSSTNSSNQYFNLYSLYNLNTLVDPNSPYNSYGQAAGDQVSTLCGTQYMSAVPVGMVATLGVSYGSSSQESETDISNSFKLSFGLDSISTAVTTAESNQDSSYYFAFNMTVHGGGTAAQTALYNAFKAQNSSGEAYYTLCAQGNSTGCNQFTTSMGSGAVDALNIFNGEVDNLDVSDNPDLSFLVAFPNGVAGAITNGLATLPIPNEPSGDTLAPYKSKLVPYAGLINQLGTLYNRAHSLSELIENSPRFNPVGLLNIDDLLDDLQNTYLTDRAALINNLGTCLVATSSNVDSACSSIEALENETAYEWYAKDGNNPNFLAQQNALALQYTASDGATPLDVLYVDALPPAIVDEEGTSLSGEAALIGFQDRTAAYGNPAAFVDVLALEPGEPVSTENVSLKVRSNQGAPSPFTLWNINSFDQNIPSVYTFSNSVFTTNSCTPTFSNLCGIDYSVGPTNNIVQNIPIPDLF